jgi:hypothetical protein
MSNVQRVTGPLFAKMRDVHIRLDLVTNQLDLVTTELESLTRKLDQQRRLIRMSFALVGFLADMQYCIQWMIWTGHYSACFVPQDRNVTDDIHHETEMAGSLVRIIADEWFAWLFLRPWYE